ncbi:T9SS type A sorting domain-containing protein [Flavobacterium cyclinae]|nr:T9SS type A sorting domain-containing protein [Flavobacterium cyclinae]
MFTNTTLSGVDFVNSSNIKIYPSPAKEIINVAISNYSGDLNIEMYDINGRIVKSVAVDFTESYAVDLNGLSSGVYVVKIAGDQLNYTEKIIIN